MDRCVTATILVIECSFLTTFLSSVCLFITLQVTYSLGPLLTHNLDLTKDARSFSVPITTSSVFAIDSKTGWITTVSQMDHEACSSYSFEVVASDLGELESLSSTTVVTITVSDVNDNPPRFERELYRGAVKESDPLGEVVAVLKTRDQDGTDQNRLVSFYITGEKNLNHLHDFVLQILSSSFQFTLQT